MFLCLITLTVVNVIKQRKKLGSAVGFPTHKKKRQRKKRKRLRGRALTAEEGDIVAVL